MGCVGFRRFFPPSPRLICTSSSHFFFCLTLTASSPLIPSVARNHRFIVLLTAHLCQNLFNFNSSGDHSSPKHSPFSTKIPSQTLPISNTTCPAKHLHMIRTSSASMRTSNIAMVCL